MEQRDRFRGSLLALALADAVGARTEGGPLARALWWVIAGRRLRWTDDTQMTLGAAESLAAQGGLDADHLAGTWADAARWSRGYGPAALRVLGRIRRGMPWEQAAVSIYPTGSYGNGAAMRASPFGLFFHDDDDALASAAATASRVTHAHPRAIAAGVAIARATALALRDAEPEALLAAVVQGCDDADLRTRLERARALLTERPEPRALRRELGNGVAAIDSAPTALHVACRCRDEPFEALLELVRRIGGDTDTIGAMAGGVWGAWRGAGALPASVEQLEARERITSAADALLAARS